MEKKSPTLFSTWSDGVQKKTEKSLKSIQKPSLKIVHAAIFHLFRGKFPVIFNTTGRNREEEREAEEIRM